MIMRTFHLTNDHNTTLIDICGNKFVKTKMCTDERMAYNGIVEAVFLPLLCFSFRARFNLMAEDKYSW